MGWQGLTEWVKNHRLVEFIISNSIQYMYFFEYVDNLYAIQIVLIPSQNI